MIEANRLSSDILRRHEATHTATTQASTARAVSTRACTECARSRERCTKSNPCQRCLVKGLRCAYPQARVTLRTQQSRYDVESTSQVSLGPANRALDDANGVMDNIPGSFRQLEPFMGPEHSNVQSTYEPYQQMVPFEIPDYPQSHILPTMDFPMNWLPPDSSVAIDYDNIVGLGIGSLDFFSFPNPAPDVSGSHITMHQESVETRPLATAQIHINPVARHNAHMISTSKHMTPSSNVSPRAVESYIPSDSPRSVAHVISPSDAPGGLYATSINGARMPCTIRARRASRLIPGAKPIRSLTELRSCSRDNSHGLYFPVIDHVLIDAATSPSSGGIHTTQILTASVYEEMQQNFGRLCLNSGINFPVYTSPRFPDLASLNMCSRLYFENFDTVIPIMHDQVTRISDHWLLALATCAIGCQYVEADEYSQMVEPLHEFLRRAITIEFSHGRLKNIGRDRHGVALAQAMTLNQVGMLYSGSSALLHCAKIQHSAMIELARAIVLPVMASGTTPMDVLDDTGDDSQETAWKNLLFEECKRRIVCATWVSLPCTFAVITTRT